MLVASEFGANIELAIEERVEDQMTYDIERRQISPQLVAYGRGTGNVEEIPDLLGEIFPRVMQHIQAHDGQVTGPPFAHYLSMGEPMEMEAGMPIAAPIQEGDGVEVGELPGGEALVTVHMGPYEELENAYDALMTYVDEHGLSPGDTMWEVYWTDPGEEPDPDNWKTEVFLPLRSF